MRRQISKLVLQSLCLKSQRQHDHHIIIHHGHDHGEAFPEIAFAIWTLASGQSGKVQRFDILWLWWVEDDKENVDDDLLDYDDDND